ncbi:MAG: hypothetical protein II821_05795 [Treponema sp.]|nr:hypothetical protein [Treponema sp.]
MKRFLKKIAMVSAGVLLLNAFVSCGGDGEDAEETVKKTEQNSLSDDAAKLFEGAYIIDSLSGVTTSWDEKIQIKADVADRIQVGSKVVFDIDLNGDYAQFMAAVGWNDCNVEKYYDEKGTEIAVIEARNLDKPDEDHPGVYKSGDGVAQKGTYYFVVTEDNIANLRDGFNIYGNFICKKIGITNLSDTHYDPDAGIELVKPADKDGYYTFWSQYSGKETGSVVFVLNYESGYEMDRTTETTDEKKLVNPTLNKAVTLKDVTIKYIINDGEEKTYTSSSIKLPINEYGTDYQAKVPVFKDYKVTKNDAIYVKITATVDTAEAVQENGTSIIQGNLIDTAPAVNYWREMCIEEQQKQLLNGITYAEASSDPVVDTQVPFSATNLEVTTATNTYSTSTHGIQAKVTIRNGETLKSVEAGDVYTVVMKGTSTKAFVPQVFFMDNTEAGGYLNLGAWGDTMNVTETAFEITKDITVTTAPSSDEPNAFMFVIDYDEAAAKDDIENATITFTEFSVTKK